MINDWTHSFRKMIYDILWDTCLNSSKGGYTHVMLPRTVTPYRYSVDETRARVTYQRFTISHPNVYLD
jgi:hypothetical protein